MTIENPSAPDLLIDPKVEEQRREQIARQMAVLNRAKQGSIAASWFYEYARGRTDDQIATIAVDLVASVTPGADMAQFYLEARAKDFLGQIIDAAAESAMADALLATRAGGEQ